MKTQACKSVSAVKMFSMQLKLLKDFPKSNNIFLVSSAVSAVILDTLIIEKI